MKKSELIELLFSSDEEEVFIVIDDNEYDIENEVKHLPEAFDGFFTLTPAALGLTPKEL